MATHELLLAFAQHGLPLHATLVDMLNEHHSHRTERRGCGYTQSTRFLADLINTPQLPSVRGWGLFDRDLDVDRASVLQRFHACSAQIAAALALPESRLLYGMIHDLLAPHRSSQSCFPVSAEKLKVGSCPLAEQFFLEIAHGRVRRGGRINIIVDPQGEPCIIEKRGLGDEHSCISIRSLQFNGIALPPGSLLAVDYPETLLEGKPGLAVHPGCRLEFADIPCGRFLRLTTLAVAPEHRKRAFTTHFAQQIQEGLFSPDTTTLDQLEAVARRCLGESACSR